MRIFYCFLLFVCLSVLSGCGTDVYSKITDPVFLSYARSAGWDTDGNGRLSLSEAAAVALIDVAGLTDSTRVETMAGLQYFTGLTELNCSQNRLTVLDLSANRALTHLYCSRNRLTALDLSAQSALEVLNCNNNLLTSLDLSANEQLDLVYCYGNRLSALDVSANYMLTMLSCFDNELTSLDLSGNSRLERLFCYDNRLGALDIRPMLGFGGWTVLCGEQGGVGSGMFPLSLTLRPEQREWWLAELSWANHNEEVVLVD